MSFPVFTPLRYFIQLGRFRQEEHIVNLEVLKDIKIHDNSNFGNDQTAFYVSSRLIYDLFIPF